MFCIKCGKENTINAGRFCIYCGEELTSGLPDNEVMQSEAKENQSNFRTDYVFRNNEDEAKTKIKKRPVRKTHRKQKSGALPIVILSILLVAALVLSVCEINDNMRLSAEINTLNAEKQQINADLSRIQGELESTKAQFDTTNNKNKELESSISLYKSSENALDNLYSSISNLNAPNTSFYSNRNVLCMKKGETATVMVHLTAYTDYTVTYEYDNGNVATGEWNGRFDNSGNATVTITAKGTGTTLFTFTNTVNSSKFQVLVIVTD